MRNPLGSPPARTLRRLLGSRHSRAGLAAVPLVLVALVLLDGRSDDPPDRASPAAPAITRSPAGAPRGTILLLHGGSWRGPDTRAQAHLVREPGELLLSRRWRIASVDYSKGRDGLRDVLAAIARQRSRLPLCLYGESAGGHLALVAAARRPSVDCVIAAAPPTDLQVYVASAAAGENSFHRAVADVIRRTFGGTPAATAPWEPVRLADRIRAEVLLLRVENDPLIPRRQATGFMAAHRSTQYVELESGDPAEPAHAWVHGAISERARRVLRSSIAAFVDRAARR